MQRERLCLTVSRRCARTTPTSFSKIHVWCGYPVPLQDDTCGCNAACASKPNATGLQDLCSMSQFRPLRPGSVPSCPSGHKSSQHQGWRQACFEGQPARRAILASNRHDHGQLTCPGRARRTDQHGAARGTIRCNLFVLARATETCRHVHGIETAGHMTESQGVVSSYHRSAWCSGSSNSSPPKHTGSDGYWLTASH